MSLVVLKKLLDSFLPCIAMAHIFKFLLSKISVTKVRNPVLASAFGRLLPSNTAHFVLIVASILYWRKF